MKSVDFIVFKLSCLLDISYGKPGVLIPILVSENTNFPYAQQMDEYLYIKEFALFFEYENYPTVFFELNKYVGVGSPGLIAFRAPDNSIFCGHLADILVQIKLNFGGINEDPILQSQLHRIAHTVTTNKDLGIWRKVADLVFDDADQKDLWINSELLLSRKQRYIWDAIDPIDPEPKGASFGLEGEIADYDTEFLIRWLTHRTNFESSSWTNVWHHLNESRYFDERLLHLGIDWVYALSEEDNDLKQSKSILFAILNHYGHPGVDWRGVGEFLLDRLSSEPYLIYYFLKPKSEFAKLIRFLTLEGTTDEVLRLLQYYIENMPKDEHVINSLIEALKISLKDLRSSNNQKVDNGDQQVERIRKILRKLSVFQKRDLAIKKIF